MTVFSVADELNSCVPAPSVLSLSTGVHRKPTCRLQSGFLSWLGVCRGGRVGVEGGGVWSYVALWRAGFASLFPWQRLSYSIQPWDGLCIWKQFPVVFQALSLFSFSCALFFFFVYCLCVFKSTSTSSSLAAVLLNLDVEHHLHLNQGWILSLFLV